MSPPVQKPPDPETSPPDQPGQPGQPGQAFAAPASGQTPGRIPATPLATPSTSAEPSSETPSSDPFFLAVATRSVVWLWALMALLPIVWVVVMSFKLPVDALSGHFWRVFFGFTTLEQRGGLSILTLASYGLLFFWLYRLPRRRFLIYFLTRYVPRGLSSALFRWFVVCLFYLFLGLGLGLVVLPVLLSFLHAWLSHLPVLRWLIYPFWGFTLEHYQTVWVEREFYRNFLNSLYVTSCVVLVSLCVGTLAGYGLARAGGQLAFWLLIIALVFRALPHSVLVSGYLPVFIHSKALLEPILGSYAPTLFGQPWAVIIVLVSINQPFTIWILRSFFQNVPRELDEAAQVDGCTPFGAFWRVIVPVMWPGVITAGLFSFLLAYNDYIVTSLLLSSQNQTMVPAIVGFFNRETTSTDQMEAVAAAVSITAPLFLLVMVFQKQLVSGLVQGAVKG